jgi:Tfp pilus assembly protein PilN
MSEIDLVPVRYHRRRSLQRAATRLLLVCAVLLVAMASVRALLLHRIAVYDQEIEEIQEERAQVEQQERRIEGLTSERDMLAQRLAVLDGLRGGIEAKQLFRVIDDSLDSAVWFRRWSFRRAGEIVDEERQAVETGYFIVLPREAPDQPRRTWQFHTHMEITAEAEDHSALAGFVRRLSQQSEIESARILNTKARKSAEAGGVEFDLAVVVRSQR